LVAGETVTLADLEPANALAVYNWTFEDVPIGTAPVMLNPTTPTPSFVVDPDAKLAGSYVVKCTVDGIEFSIEIFGKPLTYSGGRIPSFKEQEEYDGDANVKGWHEAETIFKRSVDELLGDVKASITERQAGISVPSGSSSKEVELGGVVYPGYLLAIAGKLEKAVVSGSIALNVKIGGVLQFTTTLSTIQPIFAVQVEDPGLFPIVQGDIVTVEIVGTSYVNSTASASGLALTAVLSSNLSNAPLTIGDASNTTKGITKLSVAPVLASEPIALGVNDGRVPLQNENDALQGTSGVPADANRYVTNADPRNSDSRTALGHAIGGAQHSSSTLAALNALVSDATLDDSAATRVPSSHALGGAEHSASTLAALNAKVSDATLIDTGDSRLSDARAPTAHALGGAAHSADTIVNLQSKVSDATLAILDAVQAYTKQQYPTPLALTDALNIAIAATARNAYTLLATGGVGATREIDNATAVLAGMSWTIAFTNDTGARDLTFGANYSWGDETPPTFTGQGAGEITLLTFYALSPTKVVVTALTGH
jgi:hypothetical protein